MSRKVEILFPDFDIIVTGTLQENDEPEVCEYLWSRLPLEGACAHTVSTGDSFVARCRPPREYYSADLPPAPSCQKKMLLCESKPGEIEFTGIDFWSTYGPNITEPTYSEGNVIIKVDPEYLDDFFRAGRAVLYNQKSIHKAVKMIVRRKEA